MFLAKDGILPSTAFPVGPTVTELTGFPPEACTDELLTKPDDVSGHAMKESRDDYEVDSGSPECYLDNASDDEYDYSD
jgi:hypothetical protein